MHPTTSTTRLCLRIQPWFMPSCCTLTFREFVLKLPSAGQLMQSCHQRAQWELVLKLPSARQLMQSWHQRVQWELVLELPSAGQLMQSYNIFFAFSCYILSLLFFSTVCFRFLLLKAVCRLQHDSVLYAIRHWRTYLVFRSFEQWLKSVFWHFIAKRTYFYQATNIYWQTPKISVCRRCFLWDCVTYDIFLTTRHKPLANN